MCGFFLRYERNGFNSRQLNECLGAVGKLKHRGPDGEGAVLINTETGNTHILSTPETPMGIVTGEEFNPGEFNLFFGHRRLSIIDLNISGHQPMKDESAGNIIIYNGEVYNYREIRDELKKKGHQFTGESDTEVILKAYAEWGVQSLNKFNGMWAMAIWDAGNKSLFVSRDRFGVKPLNYSTSTTGFIYASEIKSIVEVPEYFRGFNNYTSDRYIKSGITVADENTFFNGVERIIPGHFDWYAFSNNELKKSQVKYYQLSVRKIPDSGQKTENQLSELLYDAVKLRLRSDVPLGISLSGGLDSSLIYVYMREILGEDFNITAFSAVSPGEPEDESEFIDILTRDGLLNKFDTNPLTEFSKEDYLKHIYHQETPMPGMTFYAQWCVSRICANAGFKVMLCGQGADEAFAGYHHHFYNYARNLILNGKILAYLKAVKNWSDIKGKNVSEIHRIILNSVRLKILLQLGLKKLSGELEKKWHCAKTLTAILKLDLESMQLPHFLHADDRNGMAHSIETRHPFMDYRVMEFAFSLPDTFKISDGWQKSVLRTIGDKLPDEIRHRRDKKGFMTPEKKFFSLMGIKNTGDKVEFRQTALKWFEEMYSMNR